MDRCDGAVDGVLHEHSRDALQRIAHEALDCRAAQHRLAGITGGAGPQTDPQRSRSRRRVITYRRSRDMPRVPNVLAIAAISAASGVIGVATASSASASPSASAARSHTVDVVGTSVGKILVDRNGLTLYVFTRDSRDKDKCVAISGCTAVWPAYTLSLIHI